MKRSLEYRMKVLQLENVIHHAVLQLLYTNKEVVNDLIECLEDFDLERFEIDPTQIKYDSQVEIAMGQYESVLQQIGDDTCGSYAILPIVDSIVDDLIKLNEKDGM